MQEDPLTILAHSENGYIGVCDCCQEFNFVYKNLLVAFQQEELVRFVGWLVDFRSHDETYLPLPHGRNRVYRSPVSNLFLAFDDLELDEITQMFSECKLLLEARNLVSQPGCHSNLGQIRKKK